MAYRDADLSFSETITFDHGFELNMDTVTGGAHKNPRDGTARPRHYNNAPVASPPVVAPHAFRM